MAKEFHLVTLTRQPWSFFPWYSATNVKEICRPSKTKNLFSKSEKDKRSVAKMDSINKITP